MRGTAELVFQGTRDAMTFQHNLRAALELIRERTRTRAWKLKIEVEGPVLRLWLTPCTIGRVTSRHRWAQSAKTVPAPASQPQGSVDTVIDLLLQEFCDHEDD